MEDTLWKQTSLIWAAQNDHVSTVVVLIAAGMHPIHCCTTYCFLCAVPILSLALHLHIIIYVSSLELKTHRGFPLKVLLGSVDLGEMKPQRIICCPSQSIALNFNTLQFATEDFEGFKTLQTVIYLKLGC